MAGKNLGVDLGTNGGDWLFRQEGLVLGPVPAAKIVELLFTGVLDGRSEVAPMGSSEFQPLAQVDFFKIHCAKAEAKRRVDLADEKDRVQQARRRNLRLALIGGIALVLAIGAGLAATQLAIHNPWKDPDELAFADISMDPPVISVARAQGADEELIAYPGRELPPKSIPKPPAGKPAPSAPTAAAPAKPAATTPGQQAGTTRPAKPERPARRTVASASSSRPVEDPSDPDGMSLQPQFDQAAINAVVASKQKSLFPCFVEEAKRTPGLATRIPLEFVIGNDGRVSKLWVDHPQFKTGPLFECLFGELKKWPFKAYEGERATVSLSFNIGKKR
jgi:hypothetical protein